MTRRWAWLLLGAALLAGVALAAAACNSSTPTDPSVANAEDPLDDVPAGPPGSSTARPGRG